eukprot:10611900-Alexandrium_andersonii.AAC.1
MSAAGSPPGCPQPPCEKERVGLMTLMPTHSTSGSPRSVRPRCQRWVRCAAIGLWLEPAPRGDLDAPRAARTAASR